ncbi:hypothetical protein J7K06_00810 [Candidatus Bathyarchaeota archaeon]|nr:hypothetical protein [Candidatus Bathyarchaeota archaeon]
MEERERRKKLSQIWLIADAVFVSGIIMLWILTFFVNPFYSYSPSETAFIFETLGGIEIYHVLRIFVLIVAFVPTYYIYARVVSNLNLNDNSTMSRIKSCLLNMTILLLAPMVLFFILYLPDVTSIPHLVSDATYSILAGFGLGTVLGRIKLLITNKTEK